MRLGLLLLLAVLASHARAAHPELLALSYHNVVAAADPALEDDTTITVDALVSQLSWLEAAGFEPISLAQWRAAASGGPLPDKPVLLTFDDGYASFDEHVLPLLELFDFPAVLAPVTSWIEAPAGSRVPYGEQLVPRSRFLTWAQIRHAAGTGLVEVATHSHDLHRGIVGNPFGNTQPAAVTRRFDPDSGRYEAGTAYRQRLQEDLQRSVELIEREVGSAPTTIVWPYGAYNAAASGSARALGLDVSLTLDDRPNTPGQRNVHRLLIGADLELADFVMLVRGLYPPQPLRAAHVDLDYVYDADPAQQGRNLDRLLDRIKALRINRVFLQAYADPDGNGVADAVYFPNRHLPVRADLFNRVAWQLRTRAGVEVFAWMPVLAFELPEQEQNQALAVLSSDGSHRQRYHRLSPFHPETRRIVGEIYADLGRSSHFAGVLYHDDAFLTDREDVSPAALQFYRENWPSLAGEGPPAVGSAGSDAFARAKTDYLIDFTDELTDVLRRHQPALVTARNLYARPVTDPVSERWFAQNLNAFLTAYDYTAVMAMPYLEGAERPERWLDKLVNTISRHPQGLSRTVFEVQTVDWQTGEPLADAVLAEHLDLLFAAGVRHVAWYPDDFISGHPELAMLRSRVSLADHPALAE